MKAEKKILVKISGANAERLREAARRDNKSARDLARSLISKGLNELSFRI